MTVICFNWIYSKWICRPSYLCQQCIRSHAPLLDHPFLPSILCPSFLPSFPPGTPFFMTPPPTSPRAQHMHLSAHRCLSLSVHPGLRRSSLNQNPLEKCEIPTLAQGAPSSVLHSLRRAPHAGPPPCCPLPPREPACRRRCSGQCSRGNWQRTHRR